MRRDLCLIFESEASLYEIPMCERPDAYETMMRFEEKNVDLDWKEER